jgi:hypothetical protein
VRKEPKEGTKKLQKKVSRKDSQMKRVKTEHKQRLRRTESLALLAPKRPIM